MYLHLWTPKVACNNLSVTDVRALTPALRAAHDKALAAGAAVPTSVSNSLLRLEREAAAFDVAAPEPDAADAPDVNLTRAALVSAWRTASAQLDVWVKIDKATKATEAEALRGRVFAGAKPLAFLGGKVRPVWVRSGEVLDLLRAHGGARLFEARGGGAAYQQLAAAHDACGRAIGISGSLRPARARVNQRAVLQDVTAALCDYVTRARTITCPDCPGTEAITGRLLAPLAAVAPVRKGAKPAKKTDGAAEGDAKKATPRAAKDAATPAPAPAAPAAPPPANDAAPQAVAS